MMIAQYSHIPGYLQSEYLPLNFGADFQLMVSIKKQLASLN